MQNNESSHGSQPTQCGYRVVHRRLVLGPRSPPCRTFPVVASPAAWARAPAGLIRAEDRVAKPQGFRDSGIQEFGASGAEVRRSRRASGKSLRERPSHPTPDRGRAPTPGLMFERS